MATSNKSGGMGVEGPVDDSIKRAEPIDAEDIVSAFNDEYVKYYGKYVDSNKLAEFIVEMIDDLETGDGIVDDQRPEEVVRTVEHDGDFIGVSSIKLNDNLAEIGSAIIDPEYRGVESANSDIGDSIYERLTDNMIDTAEDIIREEDDPANIMYTQLLADKSAASQKVSFDRDFAVTAVYNKKFPVAYEGKGRVTAVDMIWADSEIPNEQEEVYIPEKLEREGEENIVDFILNNLNERRSSEFERLERDVLTDGTSHVDRNYMVESKAVDKPEESPMNFAEVKIVEDEEGYTWDEVLDEIGEIQEQIENAEDDYWVGVSLDANSSFAPSAAEELESFGFEYAGFNPGKLDAPEGKRDSIEMQYIPSDQRYVKQFINEAVDFMDKLGMRYSTENVSKEQKTGYNSSQALEV